MKIGRNDLCPCGSEKKYKKCCLTSKATVNEPILLLFGAGASSGSLGMINPPPIGSQLYDKLSSVKDSNTWGKIPREFAEIFETQTFEDGMNSLYISQTPTSQYNMANLLADMGIFFSKFPIDHADENLYCRLFSRYRNEIIHRRILLSTLNYECLIEIALASQGMNKIVYTGNDVGVKLLKLHGSCNFIPNGISLSRPNAALIIGRSIMKMNVRTVEPNQAERELATAPFAVMSLYTRGKSNIVCPEFIQGIQAEFQQRVKEAKAIITIGVKPNSEDKHIWDHISKSRAELYLMGNKEICQDWIDKHRRGDGIVVGHYFSDSFPEICKLIDKYK